MGRRLRIVRFGPKPGEADRNPSANRTAVLPMRVSTKKNDLFGTSWLPGSDLGAVQVNLGRSRLGGDLELGQSTDSRNHLCKSRDPELAVQSIGAREISHHRSDSIRERLSLAAIGFGTLARSCANVSGRVREEQGKGLEFQHLCYC